MKIEIDDLSRPAIHALLNEHLQSMYSLSPPESVHALDLEKLRKPEITFWSAWEGSTLVGCGALKELDPKHGEVKSMRTPEARRRIGAGRAILTRIIEVAMSRSYERLSLETGAMTAFQPAQRLYESCGFSYCGPFGDYGSDPNSVFMTRRLDALPRFGRRVVLRRLAAADLPAFQAYRCDESVGRYQGWSPQTDPQALAFIAEMSDTVLFPIGSWVQLAIADREGNGLLGDVGVCVAADGKAVELGFSLGPQSQGRGLGTEAVQEAIALVFECTAVAQVVCVTDARNFPSIRLLERAGLRKVATAEADFRGEPCIEHTSAVARHDGDQRQGYADQADGCL